ncbi:hypothetical protein ACJIZ3_019799 [Penstemon smallii]|uniref:Cytochrome P450 n=1 Tax=Penstemon smallii TaxID=265156 RepID=A0ABD3T2C1_9LAMI
MELLYVYFLTTFFVLLVSVSLHFLIFYKNKSLAPALPPGNTGWPFVGETLEFLSTGWKGHPERFIYDRIAKYSSHVFRTHLLGERVAVFCGANANKFLLSNEHKLVQAWWPSSFNKIFPSSSHVTTGEGSTQLRKMLSEFIEPKALNRYLSTMDRIAQRNFAEGWENKQEIVTYPLVKKYTFSTACRLFLSIEDPQHVDKLAKLLEVVVAGLFSIPIDLPGTAFNKAIKASSVLKKQLGYIIKQRKIDLAEGKASPNQDVLSHVLLTSDDSEMQIAERISGVLIGGHDTITSACTSIVEQMEIANSKAAGEILKWDDIQKMKYSWSVACEVLRLAPPLQGAFREAITDFMYNDFSIPKGWKLYWSTYSTHINPKYFPDPKKFDPSRFEGSGPAPYTFVPFGGGPRICPGKDYAKLEILVFMHHLVKRFKFEKMIPDEKIMVNPLSVPVKGLPVQLYPHKN